MASGSAVWATATPPVARQLRTLDLLERNGGLATDEVYRAPVTMRLRAVSPMVRRAGRCLFERHLCPNTVDSPERLNQSHICSNMVDSGC